MRELLFFISLKFLNYENKLKTVSIIQARFDSKRLPGKVLLDLGNIKVLDWVYRAASKIIGVDEVVVAISKDKTDDVIEKHCKKNNYLFFRGEKEDVLSRLYNAAKKFNVDRIVRVTADCPFLDPRVCSEVILLYDNQNSLMGYAKLSKPIPKSTKIPMKFFVRMDY